VTSSSLTVLRRELTAFGIQNARILGEGPAPDSVDYLDLIPTSTSEGNAYLLPEAVAENRGKPLLYVINRSSLSHDQNDREVELRQLRRTLGSRGERAYLGILEPGQLAVIPVALESILPEAEVYRAGTGRALTFFSRLSLGHYDGQGEPATPDYVYDEMLALLNHAAGELADTHHIAGSEVLSLIGRALFFRFLCDREVVKPASRPFIAASAESLRHSFDTPQAAAETSAWLDATFNGDFLPLIDDSIPTDDRPAREAAYQNYFTSMDEAARDAACQHMSAILHGHQPAGGGYQALMDWAKFDFAHVPVGLLSQVYEKFSWRCSPDAKQTSVHYTPRRIADYLVEEAFHKLPEPTTAKVLDPACGAGVFLVLAFRKLYQRRWEDAIQKGDERPDKKAIREIMEAQLTGFDVSENALRLAALSLYLTAIELDPNPSPPSALRFKNLRNRVLFNWRRKGIDPETGVVIGSLGEHVGGEHQGAYDVVLCNPPWTSLDGEENDAIADEVEKLSRKVISRRKGVEHLATAYQNPDRVPDLPFVWQVTEWCKPEGRIGLVLPGRNLFKQEAIPARARETLFRALAVTGILNGSNLSDTKVWPGMNQPFFLLFARNRPPKPGHLLRWVTPHCDVSLNKRGEIRVDAESVNLINVESTFEETWLWKALAIGTSLDVEVIRKIKATKAKPLIEYWEGELGLVSSNGYQVKASQKQSDASFMKGLPNLCSTKLFRFCVDTTVLEPFSRSTLFRTRTPQNYLAPLVLTRESPRFERASGCGLISWADVAYNERFDGYSAYGHARGKLLAQYLHLFVHSQLWLHYALMTSPLFGTERRSIYKTVLDECPFLPLAELTEGQLKDIVVLSDQLLEGDTSVFDQIDKFFATLFSLSQQDQQTVADSLLSSLPFNTNRVQACSAAPDQMVKVFASRIGVILRPFVRKHGKEVQVTEWQPSPSLATNDSPFKVLLVGSTGTSVDMPDEFYRTQILPLANEIGASRFLFELPNGLAVAILNQQRYWTLSRARLCAAEIINRHMTVFHSS